MEDSIEARRAAMIAKLTPEQVALLESMAGGSLPTAAEIAKPTPTPQRTPFPSIVRTPEAQSILQAAMDEDDDEEPIESLADLKARSKTTVNVYPEHPKRLKVDYLPIQANDPGVGAKAFRIIGIAKKLRDFETANPTATKAVMARIEAGEEVTEEVKAAAAAQDQASVLDAITDMDIDGFVKLLEDLKTQMAEYLSLILCGWSLKDPPAPTKEVLLEAGLGIMQDIFAAVRRKDAAKNGSGSV